MKATICDECHELLFEEGYVSREEIVHVYEMTIFGKDDASVTISGAHFCNISHFNKYVRSVKKELNS